MHIESGKILLALRELELWRRREEELLRELEALPPQERASNHANLEKVRRQIAYYTALIKDMKKEVRPPKLSHLLNSVIGV
jgi:hypothetical protein